MNSQEKYILYLSQVVDVSLRVMATEEDKRKELEVKLLDLFFSSLFNSLKDNLTPKDVEEIIQKLKPDNSFDKNLALLLGSLSQKVGEERLGEVLFDEFDKFTRTVLNITHKTLGPEASKEYNIQLAKLGQGFLNTQ